MKKQMKMLDYRVDALYSCINGWFKDPVEEVGVGRPVVHRKSQFQAAMGRPNRSKGGTRIENV
jgi:hypothetical protein